MKAVTNYTDEEADKMADLFRRTLNAIDGLATSDYFKDFQKRYGYASYHFSGKFKDILTERLGHTPTEDEIILLVDGGFSHFGANCSINGNSFHGTVYID